MPETGSQSGGSLRDPPIVHLDDDTDELTGESASAEPSVGASHPWHPAVDLLRREYARIETQENPRPEIDDFRWIDRLARDRDQRSLDLHTAKVQRKIELRRASDRTPGVKNGWAGRILERLFRVEVANLLWFGEARVFRPTAFDDKFNGVDAVLEWEPMEFRGPVLRLVVDVTTATHKASFSKKFIRTLEGGYVAYFRSQVERCRGTALETSLHLPMVMIGVEQEILCEIARLALQHAYPVRVRNDDGSETDDLRFDHFVLCQHPIRYLFLRQAHAQIAFQHREHKDELNDRGDVLLDLKLLLERQLDNMPGGALPADVDALAERSVLHRRLMLRSAL